MPRGARRTIGVIAAVAIAALAGSTSPSSAAGGITHVATATATSASATSFTLAVPVGTQSGDVMLAQVAVRGAPTITAPAGWTVVRSIANGTSEKQAVYVRVAGASEPSSYTFTFSSAQGAAGMISTYRGVDTTTPVDVSSEATPTGTSAVAAPSVTTTAADMLVSFDSMIGSVTFTPPSGFTERGDVASTGSFIVTAEGSDQQQASAGATGTVTATGSSANASVAQLVALRPAPPPAAPTNTSLPTISGTPQLGLMLTGTDGAWTGSPTSYAREWLRCDAAGAGCAAISGATGQTYRATAADVGSTIRFRVTASNTGGSSAPATSAQTAVVAGYLTVLNSTNGGTPSGAVTRVTCPFDSSKTCDDFNHPDGVDRTTWVNTAFTQQGTRAVWDVTADFTSWTPLVSGQQVYLVFGIRQDEASLSSGCQGGGNRSNLSVILDVDESNMHWQVVTHGGTNPIDQPAEPASLDLGAIVQGQPISLRFDVTFSSTAGHIRVEKNGQVVLDADRPIGFTFACNKTTDISAYQNRIQHGLYSTSSHPSWVLDSTGMQMIVRNATP